MAEMKIVKLYLDQGADFKDLSYNPINNALKADHGGLMEIIRILANAGFNLNDSSSDPVHSAIAYDMVDAAKLMIERGADLKRISENGWNYLHWCAYYGSDNCARYFNQVEELRTLTPFSYKAEQAEDGDSTILYPAGISAMDIAKINDHKEALKSLE